MATVKIGSARIDENGNAHGGKAGDQTGREVGTQAWYKHSKGWRVFRPKDAAKAAKIAQAMQAACDNPNIGYDQYQRLTLYNLMRKAGFSPAAAASPVETDCSALVRVCCAYAGIMMEDFVTAGQAKVMLATGAFDELKGSKYTDQADYLRAGDVLVTATRGHTVVVLSNGDKAGAASTTTPGGSGGLIVSPGAWNVRTGPATTYASVGTVRGGDKLLEVMPAGWVPVMYEGKVGWVSPKAVS